MEHRVHALRETRIALQFGLLGSRDSTRCGPSASSRSSATTSARRCFGGGFLGVTLFFVVSGYLITRLLLSRDRDARHARPGRLLAAAASGASSQRPTPWWSWCLAATMLFNPELLTKVRGDGLAALGYASNWWMIFHDVSYFESFGLPSPLAHLWTLAIEEQFYLAWPLVLLALLAVVRKRTAILAIVGVAIVASVVLMAITYSAVDPNRSYMGTDTRMGELLLGASARAGAPPGRGRTGAHPVGRVAAVLESRRAWLALACSTGAFVLLATSLPDDSAFAYRGGILLAALASAGMIFVAAGAATVALRRPRRRRGRGCARPPLLLGLPLALPGAHRLLDRADPRSVRPRPQPGHRAGDPAPRRGLLPLHRRSGTTARPASHGRERSRARSADCRVAGGGRPSSSRCRRLLLACLALAGVNMPAATGPRPEHRRHRVGPDRERHRGDRARAAAAPPARPAARAPDPAAPLVGRDTVAIGDSIMIDIAPLLGDEVPAHHHQCRGGPPTLDRARHRPLLRPVQPARGQLHPRHRDQRRHRRRGTCARSARSTRRPASS